MQLLSKNDEKRDVFSNIKAIQPEEVSKALNRISSFIHKTPVISSSLLNEWLGHEVLFKAEMFQKTGAFKARGALNALLKLKENNILPEKVAAFSSGNHSQGVAWACKIMGVKATIFLPKTVSEVKKQATRSYGAEVVEVATRQEAEALSAKAMNDGITLIPPFDNDDVIAGQGTACLEALEEGLEPDAVFVPCGGGGLTSGTFLATRYKKLNSKVFAVEPEIANDAARSYKSGNIFRWQDQPNTICDGARTLAISERTFYYLKQTAGVIDVSEDNIIYWTQWITHLLKIECEPTSAMAMAGAFKWLKSQSKKSKILIILSGGNISEDSQRKIWEQSHLLNRPSMEGEK